MKSSAIMFDAPMKVSFVGREMDDALKPGELLVRKRYSLISTGTELACLSGGESWFSMPAVPGYCCVSEVISAGEGAAYQPGEILFHYGSHSEHQIVEPSDFMVPVPSGVSLKPVPLLRMATIAFTAVRVSDIELGDYVAVTGLGLVGNMAAQLAALSGGFVIGVDPSAMRRDMASACGIRHTLAGGSNKEDIARITGGAGVHTAIEATGVPQVAEGILECIGYHGEIILLGTPRGDAQGSIAELLRYSHIDGLGSITFKGAHEWRYPVQADRFVKHSIERNTAVCMELIAAGKLRAEQLISHVVKPDEAPAVYLDIAADRNKYMGVLIDWN